ncbi:biotin/lipoyl-containing protein [Dysgonomonas sp. Marseille-P4361]|uniref:biotin/lipoyl-containing protein n=1 Tax=Dysgonomonas sp. Marseille-P4361 TaxID=2161820 RepID=UPI000D55A810|nr:biotin/lipoyl-containing protein [Dysgonomonas sp. Marseille-P4361]
MEEVKKVLATYYAQVDDFPDKEFKVEIIEDGPIKRVLVDGVEYEVDYNVGGDSIYSVIINNRSNGVQLTRVENASYEVINRGDLYRVDLVNELERTRAQHEKSVHAGVQIITSPMPGVILKVYVKEGDEVKIGDPLCVLVAMKMENEIKATSDGIVKEIFVGDNEKVSLQDKIMVIE